MAEHAHTTPTPTRDAPQAGGATSRRGLFAGGTALAVAATLGAGAPPNPDAELIRLGAALDAAWARQDAMPADCPDEEFDAAMDVCGALVDRIEHMPAHTLKGLMVKARAISWCNSGEEIDPDRFCPYPGATTDGRIAASIVRDLLGKV